MNVLWTKIWKNPPISESILYHCALDLHIILHWTELNWILNLIFIGCLKCEQIYPYIILTKIKLHINTWLSTKTVIYEFYTFKVPFFAHFHYWNLTRFFLFWVEVSEKKLKCKSNGSWLHYITKEKEFIIFIMKKYKKNAWKKLKKKFFFEN